MIQTNQLTKYYGSSPALDSLSFTAQQGEVLGLLGLNGAGKTTCLRILSGYLIPSSGTCSINGKDVFSNPMEIKRQIGYLPEEPPLYTELTVHDYLLFIARMRGLPKKDFQDEFERVTQTTYLKDVRHTLIRCLSLGYRKRVGIAQALIGSPSVLILDEPISGLDPVQIIETRNMIRNLAGKYTILISSHILTEVSRTCDRVIVIDKGRLAGELEGQELQENLEEKFLKLTSLSAHKSSLNQ